MPPQFPPEGDLGLVFALPEADWNLLSSFYVVALNRVVQVQSVYVPTKQSTQDAKGGDLPLVRLIAA